ncbi:MAG: hypothetical protein H6718_03090 [Polyangiaceae bacterium]|nr:hypothetical protein [Myxococcales bacterium]MCB9584353.1 hypothetical protein [Polyangiaceae bacterium]
MTDDLLKEATRALREEGEQAQQSDLTRARVMLSLHAAKRKRRSRLAFGVPLVAVFVAGAAAAQISGALPRAVERVVEVFSTPTTDSAPASDARPPAKGTPLVSANPEEPDLVPPLDEVDPEAEPGELEQQAELNDVPPPDVAPEPPPKTEPTARAGAQAPKGAVIPPAAAVPPVAAPATSAATPAQAGSAAEAPSAAPTDPSHRRYLEAHQAHFVSHDYGRALALWERYLQAFPRGRFAAEAQYNRALCLVRLGRTSEAKQALEPFASGRYGGYRQAEAQALIRAMGG